jgi:hypothetical protein
MHYEKVCLSNMFIYIYIVSLIHLFLKLKNYDGKPTSPTTSCLDVFPNLESWTRPFQYWSIVGDKFVHMWVNTGSWWIIIETCVDENHKSICIYNTYDAMQCNAMQCNVIWCNVCKYTHIYVGRIGRWRDTL